jgi:hypothetical protein
VSCPFSLPLAELLLIIYPPGTKKKKQSTCTRAIGRLRETLSDQGASSADADSVLDESINLANGIQRALYEFDSTSNHALLRLYRGVDGSHADEFLSGSDSEHIFLVYLYVPPPLLPSQPVVDCWFFRGKLYFHDAGVRPRAHFANCCTEPDICGRAPQRFQQQMVFAYIERAVLPSTARKEIRRRVADEATERPAPENMCVRRKCTQCTHER